MVVAGTANWSARRQITTACVQAWRVVAEGRPQHAVNGSLVWSRQCRTAVLHAMLQVVGPGGGVSWQQLTTSCHDCQHQHVRWQCPDPQHSRTASFCNKYV